VKLQASGCYINRSFRRTRQPELRQWVTKANHAEVERCIHYATLKMKKVRSSLRNVGKLLHDCTESYVTSHKIVRWSATVIEYRIYNTNCLQGCNLTLSSPAIITFRHVLRVAYTNRRPHCAGITPKLVGHCEAAISVWLSAYQRPVQSLPT
jgi:hypothetical protein